MLCFLLQNIPVITCPDRQPPDRQLGLTDNLHRGAPPDVTLLPNHCLWPDRQPPSRRAA
jgi:hypothetical protein